MPRVRRELGGRWQQGWLCDGTLETWAVPGDWPQRCLAALGVEPSEPVPPVPGLVCDRCR